MSGLAALKARAGTVCTSTGGKGREQEKARLERPRRLACCGGGRARGAVAAGRGAGHSLAPKATPARLYKPMPGAADVQAVHDHPFYSRPTLRKYSGENRPLKGCSSFFLTLTYPFDKDILISMSNCLFTL